MPEDRPAPPPPNAPKSRDPARAYPVTTVAGPGGRRQEMYVLHQTEDIRRRVRILCTPNFMRLFLHYTKMEKHEVPIETLRTVLREVGLLKHADPACLHMLCDLLNHDAEPVGPFQVGRGSPPQEGKDGHIEFLVRPTAREAQYDMDEAGNTDYRETNLIENALKGQHVATIHPPTRGRPGRDILGQPLPAADGKPINLRIGRAILADKDMTKLFADDDGRLIFEKNVLSLSTSYEVCGDVDYSVGKIDFIGTVEIRGSVLDDFDVTGRKGVRILGNVGNCTIASDRSIEIEGGITGRGQGRILCGGTVRAKYMNNVCVEATGDVEVRREILNSTIRTGGCLRISEGTIVGGDILAFRGIDAGVIGSELGVATRIAAGLDWRTEEKIIELDARIVDAKARIDRVVEDLNPRLEDKSRLLDLTEEQRGLLQDLVKELRDMRQQLAEAERERETLIDKTPKNRISQINVTSMLHQGVLIRFSHLRAHLKQSYRGPLSVVQDIERDTVRVLAQFPLLEDDSQERPWLGGFKDIGRL